VRQLPGATIEEMLGKVFCAVLVEMLQAAVVAVVLLLLMNRVYDMHRKCKFHDYSFRHLSSIAVIT
jgi:uncharacterized membrane protein